MKTCERCPNPVWGTKLCASCVARGWKMKVIEFTRDAEPDPTLIDVEYSEIFVPIEELVTK